MKSSIRLFCVSIALVLSLLNFDCRSQQPSDSRTLYYDYIARHISRQISANDNYLCLVDDGERLHDPDRFYSLMLVSGNAVVDSFSLDRFSGLGSYANSFYIWHVPNARIACLEYYLGGSVGEHQHDQIALLIFQFDANKIAFLDSTITEDTNSDNDTEISSTSSAVSDTLFFVCRTHWQSVHKGHEFLKKLTSRSYTQFVWSRSKLAKEDHLGLPKF